MSATPTSGTAAPAAGRHLQRFQDARVAARRLVELHADRHLPVAGVELGEVGADVADGGDADRLGERLGGHAELGGHVGARAEAQLRPVQRRLSTPRCARSGTRCISTGDVGPRLCVTAALSGPDDHERSSRSPLSFRIQVRMSGSCCEFGGDGLLKLPLGHAALGLVGQVDDERRLAHFLASARNRQNAAADDEHARHLAHGSRRSSRSSPLALSISASREPGGSSTAIRMRLASSAA